MPSSRGSSHPEIKPRSSTLQKDSLPSEPPGKPNVHTRFALETNRDHSVIFEIEPKYCILDTFVDYATSMAEREENRRAS